jgi:membrane-bound lytic murein transglycosylase D
MKHLFHKYPRFFFSLMFFSLIIILIELLGSFIAPLPLVEDEKKKTEITEKKEPVLSERYFSNYSKDTAKLNYYQYDIAFVPLACDSSYKTRLKTIQAAIPLVYNRDVKAYLDLYLVKKRPLVTRIIGRSYDYYPIFEEYLAKKNMPDELKHLAIVESALNPEAKSWCGAYGLWQFMPATARMYKLKVNDETDDRIDTHLSTDAALNYLKDLNRSYKDWLLSIAAYNCGPGNVNKAIKKAAANGKGRDFWSIKPYLPKETQGYVPAFIAACYMMNYYHEHNLKAIDPLYFSTEWIEIEVLENVTLKHLAKTLKITPEELACFNPAFEKEGKITIKDSIPVCFNLPLNLHSQFYLNEEILYSLGRPAPDSIFSK